MKNSAFPVILLLFLAVTAFFWFQILRVKDLPITKPPAGGTTKEVEDFVKLVHELAANISEPQFNLRGRDPFTPPPPPPPTLPTPTTKPPQELFVLSSISYSNLYALAVVNGKVLAEGDTIPGSEFVIENIEATKVEISDGEQKYTLEMTKRKSNQ